MKEYAFIIREDICAKYGKTEKQISELLTILPQYGELQPLDTVLSDIKNRSQDAIDNLTAELDRLKAYNISDKEIKVLNVLRVNEAETIKECTAESDAKISELEKEVSAKDTKLKEVVQESENMKRRIVNIVGNIT